MSKRFQHASRFLQGNRAIASLLSGIGRNAELLRVVRCILPLNLADHCVHASLEEEALVLVTDSPAWAARLRFFAPELLRALPPRCGRAARCRIRVQPASAASAEKRPSPTHFRLSEPTVKHLLEAAGSATDQDVAAAFRRLAEAGGASDQAEAAKGRM